MDAVGALIRPDRYPLSSAYDPEWLIGLDMGPHPLWQLEDILPALELRPGMHVLDLGSGYGATSVFLARERGVTVTACDLWIDRHAIEEVVRGAGLTDSITVVQADVRRLPFPDDAFDAISASTPSSTSERMFTFCPRCCASSGRPAPSA
jgi:SAM-dependent methyltransferase